VLAPVRATHSGSAELVDEDDPEPELAEAAAAVPSDCGTGAGLSERERRRLCTMLAQGVKLHVHLPTSLGHGAADLSHKCASLAHTVGMECSSKQNMKSWFGKDKQPNTPNLGTICRLVWWDFGTTQTWG
jgi:hypothetical protein